MWGKGLGATDTAQLLFKKGKSIARCGLGPVPAGDDTIVATAAG
ncbi:MAG: hypothetical protein WBN83_12495 [Desulfoprunum sp.]|jgi:hypothetical protein